MKKAPLLAAALVLVFAAGCSSSSNDSGMPSAAGGAVDAPAPAKEDRDLSGFQNSGGSDAGKSGQEPVKTAVSNRSIVYTGSLTVRVKDVEESAARVEMIATTVSDGFIGGDKRIHTAPDSQAFITLRVPSAKFHRTIDELAKLGNELNREVNTEDVTEASIDLESRIGALRTSVEDLRRLLSKATALGDVIQLEQQLTQRQQELASLEARKRRMDDLITFSTITVNLVGPAVVIEEPKKDDPSFIDGITSGWDAFVSAIKVLSQVIGFLLPFLLGIGVPVVLIVALVRRRRAARAARSAPAE